MGALSALVIARTQSRSLTRRLNRIESLIFAQKQAERDETETKPHSIFAKQLREQVVIRLEPDGEERGQVLWEIAIPALGAGMLYVIVFGPLCYLVAITQHYNFLDTLLLQNLPKLDNVTNFNSTLSVLVDLRLPYVYAFGVLYGVVALLMAAMVFHLWEDVVSFVVLANGMFLAYWLTYGFGLMTLNLDFPTFDLLLVARFAYIMLVFYLYEIVKRLASLYSPGDYKFALAIDGAYGIFTALVLAHGFGNTMTATLTGPAFFGLLFVSIFACEQTIGRLVYGLLMTSFEVGKKADEGVELRHLQPLSRIIGFASSYRGQRLSIAWSEDARSFPTLRGLDWALIWPAFGIFALFPLLLFSLYTALLLTLI